ncbi:uncharacterized protein PpBr36_10461 [Pyricularia pennisetigena]|uniref:uncharacterized protein n=1 Tax=Pyricularia pennisetigena TaxID=1578925 RepID=UPI001150D3D5|nr:uncharacterized protein PpBr36_10461 [Pyricularia pennisetigena]TLS21065.1 hypothetical protein PpBr36_10461 [Pyricularia pennisetigena]
MEVLTHLAETPGRNTTSHGHFQPPLAASDFQPRSTPHTGDKKKAQARRPIKGVAVVGAGYSGVVAAAHLFRYGFNVRVFERGSNVGGNWLFDSRVPQDPAFPSDRPETPLQDVTHAPPGPCYAGLKNNVPTTLMRSSIVDWPAGTPEFVTHREVEAYIASIVDEAGIEQLIELNTAVLHVWKSPSGKWHVRTKGMGDGDGFQEGVWTFDAVVAASGHYHVPRVPEIPGLAAWKALFPHAITHSKQYRGPETSGFAGKNVLIVGAGVSSLDILKETASMANKVYQSSRGGLFDLPTTMFPDSSNVERVAGVLRFELPDPTSREQPAGSHKHLPGTVHLSDGTVLDDIDHVVMATGYITSYPYLGPRMQRPWLDLQDARKTKDHEVIVTADGLITHNLHKDIFYIPDPTLAFVGVPYHISTFSFFDIQAQVIARVFAGDAQLPPRAEMVAEFEGRWVADDGETMLDPVSLGKTFHSLYGQEDSCTEELVAWVNSQVEAAGGEPMRTLGAAWKTRYKELVETSVAVRKDWSVVQSAS